MSLEDKISDTIFSLNRIAKKNKDEFSYRIIIEQNRIGIQYIFECAETSDGHPFVTGVGETIEQAVDNAISEVDSCCKAWGYKR